MQHGWERLCPAHKHIGSYFKCNLHVLGLLPEIAKHGAGNKFPWLAVVESVKQELLWSEVRV